MRPPIPGARNRWLRLGLAVGVAVVIAALFRAFVAQVFVIPSGSMQPTLEIGDRVLVSRLGDDVRRGDIVVFDGRGSFVFEDEGWPDASGTVFAKRVIGLPGDHVVCCDDSGALTVNNDRLDESGYLYPGEVPSRVRFSVIVPADRLWLMGDHRSASTDSRDHLGSPGGGMVPVDSLIGSVVARVWPPGRVSSLVPS